jgi:hypothetical protein
MADNKQEAVDKLINLIENIEFAMLTTIDTDGVLRSRPMATQKTEIDGDLWFFTSDKTHKIEEIEKDNRVNVSYAEPKDNVYVSVSGAAQISHRAEREAINMPIQGTASDIVKMAMLKVDDALRRENLQTRIVMQIHDELLLEAPDAEVEKAMEVVRREMETAVELDVPLLVEIGAGENWMNAK